jgi:hypothetical protein
MQVKCHDFYEIAPKPKNYPELPEDAYAYHFKGPDGYDNMLDYFAKRENT